MSTYQKTEGIHSCHRLWGNYDPNESGPYEPKKRGLYGCSVRIWDKLIFVADATYIVRGLGKFLSCEEILDVDLS